MDTPLYEQLYTYVVDEIHSGRLKVGDRVPSEKELADQFKVSRITSKKALEKLAQYNVITRARGKGSFVSSATPSEEPIETVLPRPVPVHRREDWRTLGFVLPDFSDVYGLNLLQAIEERCAEEQCHLVIKRTGGQRDEEESSIQNLIELGVDGLIVFPVHGEYYNAALLRLVLDKFPLVLVDRYLKGIPACAVYTDNRKAARELTDHLIKQGNASIAFLSPPAENTSTIEERIQGFEEAFRQNGLTLSEHHLLTNLFSTLPKAFSTDKINIDQTTLLAFINQAPELTAFVTSEYNIAVILAQTILGHVPAHRNYSIVCFDSPYSYLGSPFFTHVQQDETRMGRTAVDLLLAQIAGEEVPLHTLIDFKIAPGLSATRNLRQLYIG